MGSPSVRMHHHGNEYSTRRQEGSVIKFDGAQGYGFIKPDNDRSGNDLFFGRKNLTSRGQLPKVRDRVEFCVRKAFDGRPEATDILVQVNICILFCMEHNTMKRKRIL